jgi:predicted oxidoreductase
MEKRRMGVDGPECSRIVAGFWRLKHWGISGSSLLDFVHACLDMGVTTLDHADIYGDYTAEQVFGEAVAAGSARIPDSLRSRMQIVTKCGIRLQHSQSRPGIHHQHYNTDREYIIGAAEASLDNLRTDFIDVLLIHRPDLLMDADETAGAFEQLHRDGKVRFFGVSNFTPAQLSLLQSRMPFPLVINQIELSVMHIGPLHDGTLDQCQERRIAPMAWSPLAGGRLFSEQTEQARRLRRVLSDIGEETGGHTLDQVALAWLLRHPSGIFPVAGSGKVERIRSAADALAISLSREQWFRIWSASTGTGVP